MKTATITIGGKDHLLCFSARVVKACYERRGGVDGVVAVMTNKEDLVGILDEVVWMLSTMMDAGYRYAAASHLETAQPLTADALMDLVSLQDIGEIQQVIFETMRRGKEHHVEADAPKNEETTQEMTETMAAQPLSGTSGMGSTSA